MRNMSFALTTPQLLAGSKTVTRRLGWKTLKAGDKVRAVNKVMGFKKGERPTVYGICEVLDVRREALGAICDNAEDVKREGFPDMNAVEFMTFFTAKMKCKTSTMITRIEFRFTPAPTDDLDTERTFEW